MTPGPAKQFDRAEVLERAMELFWEQGYEATGIRQLLEHMGIQRQSLYDTFGSKHELFVEALAHYGRTRFQAAVGLLERPGRALDNVRAFLDTWQAAALDPDCRGCLIVNTAAEHDPDDATVRAELARNLERLEEALARTLRRARDEGDLRPDTSARDLARTLLSLCEGLTLLGRLHVSPARVRSVIRGAHRLLESS